MCPFEVAEGEGGDGEALLACLVAAETLGITTRPVSHGHGGSAGAVSDAGADGSAYFRTVFQSLHAADSEVVMGGIHGPAVAGVCGQDVVTALGGSICESFWLGSFVVGWKSGDCADQCSVVSVAGTVVWGCYELAMLLQFFRQIPVERRIAVLTIYNVGNSAAMVLGTLLGALILNRFNRSFDGYLLVFVASGCCRAVSLLALPGRRTAVRSTVQAVRTAQTLVKARTLRFQPAELSLAGPHCGPSAVTVQTEKVEN